MDGGARVDDLHLQFDLLKSLRSRGDGGGYVVDDHQGNRELFLEAGGRWYQCSDGFFKFGP